MNVTFIQHIQLDEVKKNKNEKTVKWKLARIEISFNLFHLFHMLLAAVIYLSVSSGQLLSILRFSPIT